MSSPTPKPLPSLLTSLGAPSTRAHEILTSQLSHRHLTLRPTSPDPTSQSSRSIRRKKRLAAQSHARANRRPRKLSAREKRVLGVYDLELMRRAGRGSGVAESAEPMESAGSVVPAVPAAPAASTAGLTARRRTAADWGVWKGLWRLWVGYVWEVLGESSERHGKFGKAGESNASGARQASTLSSHMLPVVLGPKIASMDLHGSLLRVVKAGCSSLVGIWGICLRETKFSVVLVDSRCCVRRVGKKGVVFRVEVPLANGDVECDLDGFLAGEGPRIQVEVSGSALLCRPADRATKKFKGRKFDGL